MPTPRYYTPPAGSELDPMFGTHCRTISFAMRHTRHEREHIHFEAYRVSPDATDWAVQRVTHILRHDGKADVRVEKTQAGMPFAHAMRFMAQLEKNHSGNIEDFNVLYPDAPALGFLHFRAFTEREGYVFDKRGIPMPRPQSGLLPASSEFNADDIARADRHVARPASEFGLNPPGKRLPSTLFVFDMFNTRAGRDNNHGDIGALRALHLLDSFVSQIELVQTSLQQYATSKSRQNNEQFIVAAEQALVQARNNLRQLKGYKVDITAFEKFTDECAIVIDVIHAQGLYDLMYRHVGNFDVHEKKFHACASRALAIYDALEKTYGAKESTGSFEHGRKVLQEMLTQSPPLSVPDAIGDFITRYRQQKTERDKPSTPPAPPKP